MAAIAAPDVNIEQLASTRIYSDQDKSLLVGQLWQKQAVILVFLRHFACIACRAHASQVWSEREKYESTGSKVIFIGNGQPDWIEIFRRDLGIEKGVVLTDPSLQSFEAAGLKSGFFNVFRPQSALNIMKLKKDGYKQTEYSEGAGSHWQLGGVLAVSMRGKPLFHFASKALGEFPNEPYLNVIQEDEGSIE